LKKKILITGANGMLGSTLIRLYQKKYQVFSTSAANTGLSYFHQYKSFDLKSDNYDALIEWSQPDIIIHCAAITNGNYCEQNPMESFLVNGLALNKLINATKSDTHVIYISTDAVFTTSIKMAKETDCVLPESIYGKSKELGEFFLIQSNADFTIIRTTIVGFNQNLQRKGFVEWIIDSSLRNEKIGLFTDVLFTPISCLDLGAEIERVFNSESRHNSRIIHLAGSQTVTKYEFGIELLNKLGLSSKCIQKGSILNFKDRAKRSFDQSLDTSLYQKNNNVLLPDLKATIKTLSKEYNERK
jgi:dTDP-4-dehydrorhamnose reductase